MAELEAIQAYFLKIFSSFCFPNILVSFAHETFISFTAAAYARISFGMAARHRLPLHAVHHFVAPMRRPLSS